MNIYTVYGRNFRNKKEAIKYHLKVYGNANWQASTAYNTKTKTVTILHK